ncbi:hypothetical protein ACQ4M4_19140 [Leptolyngbya sp. AN02str]|uniref:hypothetical protein n=1 Tax=Leptolyngbya sp. AN02str TaxID=3423363 RepID=UPI003D3212A7
MTTQDNDNKRQDQQSKESTATSGGYQTPVDEAIRQTGPAIKDDARPTARPESPSSDDGVPGSPNQGTESR